MPRFVKKPVVVDAIQLEFTTKSQNEVILFTDAQAKKGKDGGVIIPTLEGAMVANTGDWIIKGIHGEFYPCKPDIFEKSYDPYHTPKETAHSPGIQQAESQPPFKQRIIDEKCGLTLRIEKLDDFLKSNKAEEIPMSAQRLLRIQYRAMKTYLQCLDERLNDL
jgi:hypothetical protein